VRYLAVAHNERVEGQTRARVLMNLGREDALDAEGLRRLVASINRYLGEEPAPAGPGAAAGELVITSSRALGGAWLLDGLWRRLGVDAALEELLGPRRYSSDVERVLFALTANRALAPCSKLAATQWASLDAAIPGLEGFSDDQAYRAMDLLVEADAEAKVQEAVFFATANLLNLEVDVLLFDTTSTYFERDRPDPDVPGPDEPAAVEPAAVAPGEPGAGRDEPGADAGGTAGAGGGGAAGFRRYGHSKDHRPDLPQIVIGLAVTKEGIPVRVWCWPGNTTDTSVLPQVRAGMRDWKLGRVITVVDRGFSSNANLAELRRGGGHWIAGERMRDRSGDAVAALSRQGRYTPVAENLHVKEAKLEDTPGVRWIVCLNPAEAVKDKTARDAAVERAGAEIARIAAARTTTKTALEAAADPKKRKRLEAELAGHAKAECVLRDHKALGRWLRQTPEGRLALDKAKIAAEEKLDGKYLLSTSDPHLAPGEAALAYKNLLKAERGFRDLKTGLLLRPVHHRLEHRIRAHVLICWLALLLTRVAENAAGESWARIGSEMDRLAAITLTGPAGTLVQATEPTDRQRAILTACQVPPPPRITSLAPR